MEKPLEIAILAAGQGKRLQSTLPKVLHRLAGKTLLQHVLDAVSPLDASRIHVVCGMNLTQIQENVNGAKVNWVQQPQALGTGDAVNTVIPHLQENANLLVMNADVPLIRTHTIETLLTPPQADCRLLTAIVPEPIGLGRILRDDEGSIRRIVEEKDASESEKRIKEVFTGVLYSSAELLKHYLARLDRDNQQGEYYLTDLIKHLISDQRTIDHCSTLDAMECTGINTMSELVALERKLQRHYANALLDKGVRLGNPDQLEIHGELTTGRNCFIDTNVLLAGENHLGDGVRIERNCIIRDSLIADNVIIKANSIIEGAKIAHKAIVGPFARIRPETIILERAQIGNFVEVKKSIVGNSSKVNHLSYIGDTQIGEASNIGAGVVTCNYDGHKKHQTRIGNNAFIGSGTMLVAPIQIGNNALVGAGSTLTKDAPEAQLTLARTKQVTRQKKQKTS